MGKEILSKFLEFLFAMAMLKNKTQQYQSLGERNCKGDQR